MKLLRVVVLLVLGLVNVQAEEVDWKKEAFTLLDKANIRGATFDNELIGARHLVKSNTNDSVVAALALWQKGDRSTVELAWFKQNKRSVRVAILALFYAELKMNTSNAPDFDLSISKFREKDSKQRKEELEFVKENMRIFRPLVRKALAKK